MGIFSFSFITKAFSETGWPSFGGANEPDATAENAKTYSNNIIQRVLNDSSPPSQPNIPINTYIYELFNEDKRNGPISEKNWGIVFTNGSAAYPLSYGGATDQITGTGNSSGVFCVAKDGRTCEFHRDSIDGSTAKACSSASIDRLKNLNRRTVDVIASRLYFYYSFSYELTGDLAEIRGSVAFSFTLGKFGPFEYTDAKESLLQAARKAPVAAQSFRIQCNKWAIIVRLLLGEIPERTIFVQKGMEKALRPYFELLP
ncbi:hypothetical protein RYX36_035149, partial [Vicia faba]